MKTKLVVLDRSGRNKNGVARSLARRRGLNVVAGTSEEARALEAISREHPDVVLVDMQFADTEGAAVFDHLRQATEAPLVLLTSFMTEERWLELNAAGADGYLLKHVDSAALERNLVSISQRSSRRAGSGV